MLGSALVRGAGGTRFSRQPGGVMSNRSATSANGTSMASASPSGEDAVGKQPSWIPRSDIPSTPSPFHGSLDVQQFVRHELLASVLANSDVALNWLRLQSGQEAGLRPNPTPGLLIVLEGEAELGGDGSGALEQGDVVTLPEGGSYALASRGARGLQALQLTFIDQARVAPAHRSFDTLLARNELRAQIALNNPFFLMLREGALLTERKRATLCEGARVFADAFQSLLLLRQGMCHDQEYVAVFYDHLREELGHNLLLRVPERSPVLEDARLKAVSVWFSHQMLILDNVEKAVVNLVLETAGYYLGVLAAPLFAGKEGAEFFHTHAGADAEHKSLGLGLMQEQTPAAYERLHGVLDSSWNMLEAMTTRIATLTREEGIPS
jgi:hypothetical protein